MPRPGRRRPGRVLGLHLAVLTIARRPGSLQAVLPATSTDEPGLAPGRQGTVRSEDERDAGLEIDPDPTDSAITPTILLTGLREASQTFWSFHIIEPGDTVVDVGA